MVTYMYQLKLMYDLKEQYIQVNISISNMGNLEYPAYVEVYSRSQPLNLPGLSRSGLKFSVY